MEKQKLTYSLIGKNPRSFDFLLYGLLIIFGFFLMKIKALPIALCKAMPEKNR